MSKQKDLNEKKIKLHCGINNARNINNSQITELKNKDGQFIPKRNELTVVNDTLNKLENNLSNLNNDHNNNKK